MTVLAQDAAPNAPAATSAPAPAGEWPQVARDGSDTITIYQPQFETLDGALVTMSAGIVVSRASDDGGTVAVDGMAHLSAHAVAGEVPGELEINAITCRAATLAGSADDAFASRLTGMLRGAAFTVDRTTLVQDMGLQNAHLASTDGLSFAPPRFISASVPAVLVSIHGEPILAPLGSTGWSSVRNTAFVVLRAPDDRWFVEVGSGIGSTGAWMSADALAGDYSKCDAPPAEVVSALGTPPSMPSQLEGEAPAVAAPASALPRKVFVATDPAVLIAIDGAPKFSDAAPGVYEVTNANCLLLGTSSPKEWWTLQAGRWFHAAPGAPWTYASPKEVPASFSQLAATGRLAAARASVPGTSESKAAVVAAQEIRTITVKADAACKVSFAGTPAFTAVGGTGEAALVEYATNASQPVLSVGGRFYCCDSAVWFSASTAGGPWSVTASVPDAIYAIPPSCPDYPATYVEVYGSTRNPTTDALETVTFGFTSGYLGTYMVDGTPVYGTGYAYPPSSTSADGYQATPQTYGADATYDNQSGTYAPSGYSDGYDSMYPMVQPDYLDDGWCGWGWCPAWSAGWGWGWNNWHRWHHWSWWANHWHPSWNPERASDWENARNAYANRRGGNALAGSSADTAFPESNDWKKWNAQSAAGDSPLDHEPADWQKWNAASAAGEGPWNHEPADWQKWNAASAAGDEPQDHEPANWQRWNAASAAGDEPQDHEPADWQRWNAASGSYPTTSNAAAREGRSSFTRNTGYGWTGRPGTSDPYATNRGTGWNTTPSRSYSNPVYRSSWGAEPRSGMSGIHPSYGSRYRPSYSYQPAMSAHRFGGFRRR